MARIQDLKPGWAERVSIYARVSTADKGQDVENQVRDMVALAKQRGWVVHDEYLEHESGGNAKRPKMAELMEDARKGKFQVLLFWSLDRFSREGVYETLDRLRLLDSYGVRFLSVQEQYLDTLGPFREAVIGILAAVAKLERQRLSERVKSGMRRAVSQGVRVGRPPVSISRESFEKAVREHWSINEMARAFSVSRSTVIRYMKQYQSDRLREQERRE